MASKDFIIINVFRRNRFFYSVFIFISNYPGTFN